MLHHANLLIGSKDWAFSQLPPEHSHEGQDMRILEYDSMTIAHTRSLIDEAHLKSVEGDEHIFVIITNTVLREAQNALLKLFEDPNPGTVFYLVLPREEVLLPTLRSRLHLLDQEVYKTKSDSLKNFIDASYADRLAIIEKKLKAEDAEWVSDIVSGLEKHASQSRDAELIKDTLMLSQYIHTKGASKKMLLEHIALTL